MSDQIQWLPLVHKHIETFASNEKQEWDKARSWMQGRYWSSNTGENEADMLRSSLNYVFAITETASSSLVPRSPSWSVVVHDEEKGYDELATRMEEYLRVAAKINDLPQELVLSVQDAILCGRSVLKTTWDKQRNVPRIRRVDPRAVFFDLSAQRTSDVAYWIEVTAVGHSVFRQRVEAGHYRLTDEMPTGGDYPVFLRDRADKADPNEQLRNFQRWVPVYEVYDVQSRCTYHYFDGQSEPLLKEEDNGEGPDEQNRFYVPYTLYALNSNAQDLRGLSEILLITPNVDDINRTLTYWLNIVRRQIPRVLVDGTVVSQETINKLNATPVGGYALIKKEGETNLPISAAFSPGPVPQMPPDVLSYMSKLESNVSFVSALAEAARGQVTGAKTATEMALIEAQLRTRLQARQAQVDRAIADIGRKMVYLSKQYLKNFRVPEQGGYARISSKDIESVDVEVEIVPYNPIETNRAVYEERFMKLLSYMTSRPSFDQREIDESFVKLFRLDPRVLTPVAEVAEAEGTPSQEELAAMAAEVGATPDEVLAATGGQATPGSQLPAQAAAFSNNAVAGARPTGGAS